MLMSAADRPLRVAYCSPLNPQPSGIADYSEELLPYLAQFVELTVFVDDGLRPVNPALSRSCDLQPLRRLPRLARRGAFDSVVYHLGNSPAHAAIWRTAQQVPGVVVLHELVLHHFMLWYAANVRRDVQHYVRMMQQLYGEPGAHMAQLMIRSRFSDAAFDFSCVEPVLAAATAVIAHNRWLLNRVTPLAPQLPQAYVPMGVPLSPLLPAAAARQALGLPADQPLLAAFGHINAWKRMESVLRALAALNAAGRNARLLLVGSVSPNYDLAGLVRRLGLSNAVTITGYVPQVEFQQYVAAADICLNLRYPTAGETSASLLRLLGAARPTLVSAVGSFTELPPHVAAQVDLGPAEADQLVRYSQLLLDDRPFAAALGNAARRFIAAQHSLPVAAAAFAAALAGFHGRPAPAPFHPQPLWDPTAVTLPAAPRPIARPQPAAAPVTPLIAAAAHAAAELDLRESDDALLARLAAAVAELS
jgi:glycosyltransferase involved in cell wall biosynthesis